VRMSKRMDFDHRRHNIPRHQRITHATCSLDHAVADIADSEDTRFPTSFVDAVAYFVDQLPEVERPWMAHSVSALDEDLRLFQVFLGPVHAHPESISLKVHCTQFLTAKLMMVYRDLTSFFLLKWCLIYFTYLQRISFSLQSTKNEE